VAGIYTEVVEIILQSSALPDEIVPISARVKNLYSAAIGIKVIGSLLNAGVSVSWAVDTYNVPAGAIQQFNGGFRMPGADERVRVYSLWYGSDGIWRSDDYKEKTIKVAELVPEFSQFQITDYRKV